MVNMQWVPFSNSHDGDGFTQLISEKNGTALFGAWVLIVQVASKCTPRGTLLRSNGDPHDFDSLARMTRGDKKVFQTSIKVLIKIGWIEEIDAKTPMQEGAGSPHPTDEEGKEGIEGNGIEGNEPLSVRFDFLNDENFSLDWNNYVKSRKGKMTDRAKELALMQLHKQPIATAISMLQESIKNGWKGLFEPKGQNNGTDSELEAARERIRLRKAGYNQGSAG